MEQRQFAQVEDEKRYDRRRGMSVCDEAELSESAVEVSRVEGKTTKARTSLRAVAQGSWKVHPNG
jgi:hypothetical protein